MTTSVLIICISRRDLRVDTVPVPRTFTLTARNAAVLDHDQTG
jgi:hypothetical protein